VPLGVDPTPEPSPTPEPPEPVEQDPPDFGYTFGDTVGTNGFFVDDLKNYDNISFVREYHNWTWTEASAGESVNEGIPQTASTLTPDVMFTNRWGAFDNYYQQLKTLGVGVNICIQGSVADRTGLSGSRPNYQGDKNSEKASSYYAHGASMFQHAARYGSNKNIDPSLVKVAPGTTKEIGLDLIKYYENWNEPNATWETAGNQFTAAQFAAMTSADYDGHMGTMGPGVGIKNADPNAKMVMGGLVGLSTDFIKKMNLWFEANRTKEQWLETHDNLDGYVMYPFDVINVHYYCPDGLAATGTSPEDDNLYARIAAVVSFRNRYYPKAELWLSEFGWDSNQGSPQSATVEYTNSKGILMNEGINKGLDGKEVQGRWLVREYLILAAAGVDRSQQFMMPDAGTGGSGRFESCGMIEMATQERKPSWYYVGTMNYWLNTTKFEKALVTGKDDLLAYQFKEKDNDDRAIALWCTTSSNQEVNGYELALPEGTNYAYAVTMEDKTKWGVVKSLPIIDGKVSVDVSEKPIFVLARNTELVQPEIQKKIDLSGATITGTTAGTVDGTTPVRLFNEWKLVGDPLNDIPGTIAYNPGAASGGDIVNYCWPSSSWQQFEATMDLGAKYHITGMSLYRVEGGTGENVVKVSYGDQSSWTEAFTTSKAKWVGNGWWDSYVCNFDTQQLKFAIPVPGDIKIREAVIYGYWVDEGTGPGSGIGSGSGTGETSSGSSGPAGSSSSGGNSNGDNLFKMDFEDLSIGSLTTEVANAKGISYYGASAEVVDGSNKVLKLLTNPNLQEIQFDILNCDQLLVPGKNYVLEYQFKADDNFTMPGLMYTDLGANWTYLFNHTDNWDSLAFNSRWWGKYTFSSNVWNRMVVKFHSNVEGGYSFELILNGVSLVTYDVKSTDPAGTLPYKLIRLLFNSGATNKQSIVYLDNVYLYEENEVPDPVFETKPDVSAVDFLFDDNFDTLTTGTLLSSEAAAHLFSTWGANITVENKNATDITKGKVLKFTGTGKTTEFAMDSFVPGLETGVWYNMDYKFKVSDEFSSPVLRFTDTNTIWSHIYNREGNNAFKPTFGGSSEITAVTKGVWHHMKTRFKFNSSTKFVDYEIFYDDLKISTGIFTSVSFPLTKLVIMTDTGADNNLGVTYLDDVWFYKEKPQPSQISKLVLTPSMAIRLTAGGNEPGGLLDEQSVDPLNDSTVQPNVNSDWSAWGGHRWILVDLGKEYTITNTFLYDAYGDKTMFAMYYGSLGDWNIGEPGSLTGNQVEEQLQTSNWTQALTYDFNGWMSWFKKDVNFKTRYLILGFSGDNYVGIPEMILYGY
jgi:hypothetical protein